LLRRQELVDVDGLAGEKRDTLRRHRLAGLVGVGERHRAELGLLFLLLFLLLGHHGLP
jgi:hypothetical protein